MSGRKPFRHPVISWRRGPSSGDEHPLQGKPLQGKTPSLTGEGLVDAPQDELDASDGVQDMEDGARHLVASFIRVAMNRVRRVSEWHPDRPMSACEGWCSRYL